MKSREKEIYSFNRDKRNRTVFKDFKSIQKQVCKSLLRIVLENFIPFKNTISNQKSINKYEYKCLKYDEKFIENLDPNTRLNIVYDKSSNNERFQISNKIGKITEKIKK